jgi:hypothetical protein
MSQRGLLSVTAGVFERIVASDSTTLLRLQGL